MQAAVRPYVMAGVGLAGATLIAATPIAPPPDLHVSSEAVRLTSGEGLLGDLGNIDLTGGLFNDLGSLANFGALGDLGGLANIPYNVFANIVNIPYYESLALQEYAYALGPAGQVGGVPGWIPPGATVANGGVDALTNQYALGGTGSWYMQSIGNTWGWDEGNWPQVAGLSHFLFPYQFELPIIQQLQGFAQAELIDGARVNCEFECASILGYLGGWARGETPLTELLSPTYKFPDTIVSTIGNSSTGIINVNPLTHPLAVWAGQPGTLNPLAPFEAIANNLLQDPGSNPLQFPDAGSVFTNAVKLVGDSMNNFNPFIEGSFLYWGAPTAYSIPSFLAGTLQDLTGIPNQFGFPLDQIHGAEPEWGYTAGPSSLLTGIPKGLEYLLNGPGGAVNLVDGTGGDGLLGYLNPATYLTAIENLFHGQFPAVLDYIPLLGYLGLPEPGELLRDLLGSTGGALPTDLAALLGSADPTALLGSFDPATLFGSFDLATVLGTFDPTTLIADLGSLLPL